VGRDLEFAQLQGWLDKALGGERQIVFVTGEPGIGKTTLVEAFLQSLESSVQRLVSKSQNASRSTVQTLDPRRQTLDGRVWIGRGQCIEHYGPGEAYLPLLEALGRLCREPGGQRLVEILSQHAPTWLAQMSALLSSADLEALQRKTQGVTQERMLRELAEAMEVLTTERPLVLWLEDLQWSDVSTLDWLAVVARRREPARLLVIGAYRPIDVIVSDHPLKAVKHELQLHEQCAELPLGFLREEDVAEYLAQRFHLLPSPLAGEACPEPSRRSQDGGVSRQQLSPQPPHPGPLPQGERGPITAGAVQKLAHLIHRRTDGNPLFMINVVDHLVAQGVMTPVNGGWTLQGDIAAIAAGAPESLRQLIERQIERLSRAERRVLEVASVAGAEFSAAAVAAGAGATVEEVEEGCSELARREQFLQARGSSEWPDGTVAARYGFLHALYQEVLYDRLTAGRRQRLHQQIGERVEQGYGDRAREIAAELAVQFERGRNYHKAVQYLQQAGENAVRRSAHQEAITLLTKGLELLQALPNTPERAQQELRLQITLGPSLMAIKGNGCPEAGNTYTRAREICQQVGETPQLRSALGGLLSFHLAREELQTARELGEQLLSLTQHLHDPALLVGPHHALGHTLFSLGELVLAREHLEQGIALYNPQKRRSYTFHSAVVDPGMGCLSYAALTLWVLGYPDQALKRSHEALTAAQELSSPYSLAFALDLAAMLRQFSRESQAAQEQAESAITLCAKQGFPFYLAWGISLRGCALAEQGQVEEGIAQIRQGLAAWQATGAERHRPYFLTLLAEAYGKAGQTEEGLTVLVEALAAVNKTGGRVWEAELYRLKGELTLKQSRVQSLGSSVKTSGKAKVESGKLQVPSTQPLAPSPQTEAEACFRKAIEIAQKQQAKSLELRATTSLARLWQQQDKKKEAHRMLAEIYGWFTEGFDTKDLQEAKALLAELGEW
jgi:predicted ATPase